MSKLTSKRLLKVCELVGNVKTIADIGCDHGYTAIELIKSGKAEHAICADLRSGPLERAKAHVKEEELEDRIECRLSDGLKEIKVGEADSVIIAGMGGMLMMRILEDGMGVVKSADELVLSPQSDIDLFRGFLVKNSLLITDEKIVEEDSKFYQIIKVHFDETNLVELNEIEKRYGPILLRNKDSVLKKYLEFERGQLLKLLEKLTKNSVHNRAKEVEKMLLLNEEALRIV